MRLTEADNGLGGSVSFAYGMEEIEECRDCNRVSDHPMRRPVIETVWRDGTGGVARSVYAYSGVKGTVQHGMFEYLGHAWSQRRLYTLDADLNLPGYRFEQAVASWYHQIVEDDLRKIDDRRGRLKQRAVYSPEEGLMQREEFNWTVHESKNDAPWVRKELESVYVFDGDGDGDTRARHTHYFYEAAFGNVIRVEVRDAEGKEVLRKSETEYSADKSLIDKYIGDRPSRAWISDERGRCIGETRYGYDANGNLIKSEQPTTECGESDAANLIVSRLEYDAVGNVTRAWTEGTSNDIRTEFDTDFKLFPVRRYNANANTLDETGKYYGINGDDSRAEGGSWGAMQEFCAVDGVCSQQAYDDFGRASHLWAKGAGYPDRAKAQTQWRYYTWGSMGQNANVIVTQSLPLCEGNFTRKLYDGFGHLVQEQGPRQGWETTQDGCSEVENRLETVVDYGYDGLGRLLRTSVPRPVVFDWVHATDWDQGYTATTYDGLSRPASTRAPNGSVTTYHYNGLTSSVVGGSEGDDARRMLSWQQQDQLGRTTLLRSYVPGGDEWTLESEISLAYDGANRLTQVYRRDGGEGRWQPNSSIDYDFLGRKTGMRDADLGNWSYAYNALGQLTRQTDARDKTSSWGAGQRHDDKTEVCRIQSLEYLVSTPINHTCTNLAEHLDGMSHDVVSDFLKRERLTANHLWELVQEQIDDSADAYLIIDDSVQDKRDSRSIEMVKLQYSGAAAGLAPGIAAVNLIHTSAEDGAYYPIDFRIDAKEADGKSKNDHFQEMLLRAVGDKQIQAKTVLIDSWYGSWRNLKLIHRLGLTFYTTRKANRLVSLSADDGYIQLDALDWTDERLKRGIIVKLKKLPFKVKLFKFVAINGDVDWVIANDPDETVITQVAQNANKLRWQVEEFHRELKQLTGSAKCQCRKARSQRNHLACCYHAWLSLKVHATLLNKTIYRVHTDLFSDYLRNQLRCPTIPAFQPT